MGEHRDRGVSLVWNAIWCTDTNNYQRSRCPFRGVGVDILLIINGYFVPLATLLGLSRCPLYNAFRLRVPAHDTVWLVTFLTKWLATAVATRRRYRQFHYPVHFPE